MFEQERAEHAVHETRRGVAPERFREFDCFVDRDLDRHVLIVLQLEQRHAQDVAINNRKLVYGPFRRVLVDDRVKLWATGEDTGHERGSERDAFFRQVVVFRQVLNDLRGWMSRAVNFVKGLERDSARLASSLQKSLVVSWLPRRAGGRQRLRYGC
jgi:hypothetical protein